MQKKYYLTACCILKDEDPFILEWLTYHSLIGVEHFFMYDNESKNPVGDTPFIKKFTAQGKVTVLDAPGKTMQLPCYTHALQTFGHLTKWMAFIDLDEFICPTEDRDLRPFLAAYEDYAALGLNWKCFSSGGHLSSPPGLVINNYRERFIKEGDRHLHIKSIVQPEKVEVSVHTPHSFWPHRGEMAVRTDLRPIARGMAMTPICWEKATVHHYVLKSQQDAQRRMERGRADILSEKPTIDYSDFYSMVAEPVEPDESILRFAPETESWMQAGELPEEYAASLEGIEPAKLLPTAELLLAEGKLVEAGIILCHATLSQSENHRLWQLRAKLAGLLGREELVKLFAQKAARIKAGLPRRYYPDDFAKKELNERNAEKSFDRAKQLAKDKQLAGAEAVLAGMAQKYRLNADMWRLRGEVARLMGCPELAKEYVYNALALKEFLPCYETLLHINLAQHNYVEARELVFYLLMTQTYRVCVERDGALVEDESFYEPLRGLLGDLKRLTGG